jgi:dTDP-glucose 4,6-dehydratase
MGYKILITGGAGFIGSHLIRHFINKYPEYEILNLDKLTYAGNLENLKDIEKEKKYSFIKGDITDAAFVSRFFELEKPNAVIHLAAESHVDRSILYPGDFINTNIIGTLNLLNSAMAIWNEDYAGHLFYHISTDEVYGTLGDTGYFTEKTAYDPHSPYSASKAGSDHLVRAYFHTYHLPVVISNCSNNYGPNQFPEKMLPLMINNILHNKPLPVYGKGEQVRDWLWVKDHAAAIDLIFHNSKAGETYNIGGNNEWKNIDLVNKVCDIMDRKLNRPLGTSARLITFVKDRAGHDKRYAIDASKIKNDLGWQPSTSFEEGCEETITWYLSNTEWLTNVTSGAYHGYYDKQYRERQLS